MVSHSVKDRLILFPFSPLPMFVLEIDQVKVLTDDENLFLKLTNVVTLFKNHNRFLLLELN